MHQTPDIALLITLTAAFIFILAGVAAYGHDRYRYRRDLLNRIAALRIGKMLKHAGISRGRYLRKAKALTIEKHLLVCRQCTTTKLCDACLEQGEDIPEHTFCRNYRELIRFR